MPPARSPDETYVSQEVCTSVLHEAKGAIRRAQVVSDTPLDRLGEGLTPLWVDQDGVATTVLSLPPSLPLVARC